MTNKPGSCAGTRPSCSPSWPASSAAQTKVREKDLPPRHQDWLKLTTTFILPAERDVFLSLTGERDRDIFIEAFWKQRDPTQATPQNEYKDEMEAALQVRQRVSSAGGPSGRAG